MRRQPKFFEITEDTVLTLQDILYVTFYVNGTWQVEIDGLKYLPDQNVREEMQSNLSFSQNYTIRFVADTQVVSASFTADTVADIADNPNLKPGKFVYARYMVETKH